MIFLLVAFCGDLLSTVTRPWRQLFWLALQLYISVWSIVLTHISETFSKCWRIATAYRREKELDVRLHALRLDYEEETLRNIELQQKLDAFTRDRRRIAETLDLVTGDKKKAAETIKILRNRVQDLEYANQQLVENEEILRRGLAEAVSRFTAASKHALQHGDLASETQAKDLASKTLHDTLHDTLVKDAFIETTGGTKSICTQGPDTREVGYKEAAVSLIAESHKGVAFTSSMFSVMLSTLVAAIAWEAQDPCTPLVIALFIVVSMSLGSVVRFFTKAQSQQGFLAVAILSLNWFVLGTLAHPALPHFGRLGSGIVWSVGGRFLKVFGGTFMTAVKVASHEPSAES